MIGLLANLMIALLWSAAMGTGSLEQLAFGFVLGYFILRWMQPLIGQRTYFRKVALTVGFIVFVMWEVIKANYYVAREVISPRKRRRPGIVAVPLDAKTDFEIMLLANIITLTPGTISLDVSDDRSTLYIHAIFMDDADKMRDEIKGEFERRVIELLR